MANQGEDAAFGIETEVLELLLLARIGHLHHERLLVRGGSLLDGRWNRILPGEGKLRRRLEAALVGDGWEVNNSAVRFAITNGSAVSGAKLVKGNHLRLR